MLPPTFLARSVVVRSAARVLRVAALSMLASGALALAGCEDETPVKKDPATAADPAEQAKLDKGKQLIRDGNDAFRDEKYDRARKLFAQALELGNESQRFEIDEAVEKLDKKQAKLWANEVEDAFKNKDCKGAIKELQQPLKDLGGSEAFVRELRRLVGADALKCAQDAVDAKILGMDYAGARKAASAPDVTGVLGPATSQKLAAELEGTILESLRTQLGPDLKAKKWAAAAEKIEAFAKKGDATEDQVESLIGAVREGIGPEIAALAARSVGKPDAAAALKQIDQDAKLARWAIVEPGLAKLEVGAALPEELTKKRAELAIWVEAQRLKMRPLAKPEVRWTHGKIDLFSPAHVDTPSGTSIAHGTQVWILGTNGDKALVTTTDPAGSLLTQMLDKVVGWASSERLVKENTTDWLVPDDQLVGQRVWGPLRPPDGMWELGTVTHVSGKDITVQRLADGAPFKLTRQKLRSGRLSPGTRVLTFCLAKDQPAQVIEVPKTARSAKLKCDGGQEKEEDLASLRSKPELLPQTK